MKWPNGAALAMYGSRLLEIYEPYEQAAVGKQVRVRAVAGDWPGLMAIGVSLLRPLTPLAWDLLHLAADR